MKTVEQRQMEVMLKKLGPKKSKLKVFGWDVFIPVFDNEDLINKLRLMDGVRIKPNFKESNCEYCGESFYSNFGTRVRFCSTPHRAAANRMKKIGRRPFNKRGRPRKVIQ